MCVKISIRANLFYGQKENWDQITPSNSPRAPGTEFKFEKERVHREASCRSVNLMSAVLARPGLWKDHKTKPCTKKDAPTEWDWTWRKMSTNSKNTDKATFHSPIEARAMPAPTSKNPEEREFVVDSRATKHMLSKKEMNN